MSIYSGVKHFLGFPGRATQIEDFEGLSRLALADIDTYLEEERAGLHSDCDAPLTPDEIRFVNSS